MSRPRVVVAWVWAGLVGIGAVGVGVVGFYQGALDLDKVALLFLPFLYSSVGLAIVVRQPGNRVAWIFFVVATYVVLEGAASLRIEDHPAEAAWWDVAAIIWTNTGYWIALVIPMALLLYIFPTGHFLTRRWRWAGYLAWLIAAVVVSVEVLPKQVSLTWADWSIANPIGLHDVSGLEDSGPFVLVFGLGLITLMIGGIPAIVVRYRRSTLVVRGQIKWVVFALVVTASSLFAAIVFNLQGRWIGSVLFFIALAAVPLAVPIAILRYRLFDIDRLISRTLSYAIVVASLAAVFIAVVTVSSLALPTDSGFAVAAATLAAAALFNPVRVRVQRSVDRRFNRSGYEAQIVNERFATNLQKHYEADEVAAIWVTAVVETLQPATTSIWIRSEQPRS